VRLPRGVAGENLARALERFGYQRIGQRGSHIHLVAERSGRHRIAVPAHRAVKAGTLSELLKQVAEHHGMTRDELIDELNL
jgi:predicted RNA binding protein YcfA (HicA-like mRNA interferase family)